MGSRKTPADASAVSVDRNRSAVVVVDMQNEFCTAGNAYDLAGFESDLAPIRRMIPRLARFLAQARGAGIPIVYVQAIYGKQHDGRLSDAWMRQAARRRPRMYNEIPVCQEGSWGAQIIEELAPQDGDVIVQKHRYSAFVGTGLADRLRDDGISTLLITGVGTCGCVDSTARDAFMADFDVCVVDDCVAMAWSDLHDFALAAIDALFGEVRSSNSLIAEWQERAT
jgi:ureidoacrylate peracid hydrolase